MIYVTVGRPRHGFDRLVKAVDELAPSLGEEVFIQKGSSTYTPVNSGYRDYLTFPEADELLRNATVVISHAGIGTIIGALRAGTPIVVVPRLKRFGEHFNDHQLQIAEEVKGRPGIEVVDDVDGLSGAVDRLRRLKGSLVPAVPGQRLVGAIEEFLGRACKGRPEAGA